MTSAVQDGTDASVIVPMTIQEWWWSIRDGYVGEMISEYQKHGGLLSVLEDGNQAIGSEDIILPSSFTTQEWSYAAKDGYLSDMIEHYMRNGGL